MASKHWRIRCLKKETLAGRSSLTDFGRQVEAVKCLRRCLNCITRHVSTSPECSLELVDMEHWTVQGRTVAVWLFIIPNSIIATQSIFRHLAYYYLIWSFVSGCFLRGYQAAKMYREHPASISNWKHGKQHCVDASSFAATRNALSHVDCQSGELARQWYWKIPFSNPGGYS